jgi:hypothetical protein
MILAYPRSKDYTDPGYVFCVATAVAGVIAPPSKRIEGSASFECRPSIGLLIVALRIVSMRSDLHSGLSGKSRREIAHLASNRRAGPGEWPRADLRPGSRPIRQTVWSGSRMVTTCFWLQQPGTHEDVRSASRFAGRNGGREAGLVHNQQDRFGRPALGASLRRAWCRPTSQRRQHLRSAERGGHNPPNNHTQRT